MAVELYTLTKSFSMAGWRMGFLVGNEQVVAALGKLKSYLDYGTFQPIQIASIVAMNEAPDYPLEVNAVYRGRRDALVDGLARCGWEIERPRGTIFIWARSPSRTKIDSLSSPRRSCPRPARSLPGWLRPGGGFVVRARRERAAVGEAVPRHPPLRKLGCLLADDAGKLMRPRWYARRGVAKTYGQLVAGADDPSAGIEVLVCDEAVDDGFLDVPDRVAMATSWSARRESEALVAGRELEQREVHAVLEEPLDGGADAELDPHDRVGLVADRLLLPAAQVLVRFAQDLRQQLLLRGEVPVEDALADAEALDDVGDRRRVPRSAKAAACSMS